MKKKPYIKKPNTIQEMSFWQKIYSLLFSTWVHMFKFFWCYWAGFLVGLFSALAYPFPKSIKEKTNYFFLNFWGRGVLYGSGFKYKISVAPEVDFSKTYVFVGNHSSSLDIYIWQMAIRQVFNWMAKRSLFNMPFIGTAMWAVGHIAVYRNIEDQAATIKNVRTAVEKLKNHRSIAVFPEGTRSFNGKLLPFKKGAFKIAKMGKVEVVPIVVKNVWFAAPKKKLWLNPYPLIEIKILSPMNSADKDISDKVRDKIQDELNLI